MDVEGENGRTSERQCVGEKKITLIDEKGLAMKRTDPGKNVTKLLHGAFFFSFNLLFEAVFSFFLLPPPSPSPPSSTPSPLSCSSKRPLNLPNELLIEA